MLFYLTTLNLEKFLREDVLTLNVDETNQQVVVVVEEWKHADFLCRNYILNGLDNILSTCIVLCKQQNCYGNLLTRSTKRKTPA